MWTLWTFITYPIWNFFLDASSQQQFHSTESANFSQSYLGNLKTFSPDLLCISRPCGGQCLLLCFERLRPSWGKEVVESCSDFQLQYEVESFHFRLFHPNNNLLTINQVRTKVINLNKFVTIVVLTRSCHKKNVYNELGLIPFTLIICRMTSLSASASPIWMARRSRETFVLEFLRIPFSRL